MGGMGSGGHNNKGRGTTGDALSLDVNILNRAGALKPGWSGGWNWTRGGEPAGNIHMVTGERDVVLIYRTRTGDGPWQSVEQPVTVSWSPCRYGGQRPFLICPGCGRSVMKVYIKLVARCRSCHRLSYPSQREREMDRLLRRANKVRTKLGGDPGMVSKFPDRPKGMHRNTYDRLRHTVFEAEMEADEAMLMHLGKVLGRLDKSDGKEFW